jgi:hypothetical protein
MPSALSRAAAADPTWWRRSQDVRTVFREPPTAVRARSDQVDGDGAEDLDHLDEVRLFVREAELEGLECGIEQGLAGEQFEYLYSDEIMRFIFIFNEGGWDVRCSRGSRCLRSCRRGRRAAPLEASVPGLLYTPCDLRHLCQCTEEP